MKSKKLLGDLTIQVVKSVVDPALSEERMEVLRRENVIRKSLKAQKRKPVFVTVSLLAVLVHILNKS